MARRVGELWVGDNSAALASFQKTKVKARVVIDEVVDELIVWAHRTLFVDTRSSVDDNVIRNNRVVVGKVSVTRTHGNPLVGTLDGVVDDGHVGRVVPGGDAGAVDVVDDVIADGPVVGGDVDTVDKVGVTLSCRADVVDLTVGDGAGGAAVDRIGDECATPGEEAAGLEVVDSTVLDRFVTTECGDDGVCATGGCATDVQAVQGDVTTTERDDIAVAGGATGYGDRSFGLVGDAGGGEVEPSGVATGGYVDGGA